jgi:hypothetical protein
MKFAELLYTKGLCFIKPIQEGLMGQRVTETICAGAWVFYT